MQIAPHSGPQRVDCQSSGRHWFDLYRLEDLLTDAEIDEQCDKLSASLDASQP